MCTSALFSCTFQLQSLSMQTPAGFQFSEVDNYIRSQTLKQFEIKRIQQKKEKCLFHVLICYFSVFEINNLGMGG